MMWSLTSAADNLDLKISYINFSNFILRVAIY